MSSKFDHNVESFICSNFPATYKCGSILLPSTFVDKYGAYLSRRVYVEMPTGSLWRGCYVDSNKCIEGLESMFEFYDVKPYNFLVLFYNGGKKFGLEIFNVYGVEIRYNSEPPGTVHTAGYSNKAVWLNDCYYLSTDLEVDKLCGQFTYNCYNSKAGQYELVIAKKHLQPKIYNQIFSKEGCNSLQLEDDVTSIQIGFKNLMWNVDVQWINDDLFFSKHWCDFAKEGKIREGDICVFQKTSVPCKFEVAVFEKNNIKNFNTSGVTQGKSVMKWLKVVNCTTTNTCEVDVPRVFIEEYSILLLEDVHLILPDGKEYPVHFSSRLNRLMGLQPIMQNYSVKEDYVFFFDYVGRSHFLLSIYNEKRENCFGYLRRKILLHEIMRATECPIRGLLNQNLNTDLSMGEEECFETAGDDNHDVLLSFAVELQTKHLDDKGNGVFIGHTLFEIFKNWSTGTLVTILCGGKTWFMEVNRRFNYCQLAKGWESFTFGNKLSRGQILNFVYRGSQTFEVYVNN